MMEMNAVMDELQNIANARREKFECSNVVIVVKGAPSFLHSAPSVGVVVTIDAEVSFIGTVDVRTVPTLGARSENRSRRSG